MTAAFSLDIGELRDVKHELGHFVKWRELGLNLGFTAFFLDVIEKDYRTMEDRLTSVLLHWLRRNYDIDHYGLPSWTLLAEAVKPLDPALGLTIMERHPSSFQSEFPREKLQC